MKLIRKFSPIYLFLGFLSVVHAVNAGVPLWEFKPDAKAPPKATVSATGSIEVRYTVVNHSSKAHDLFIKPQRGVMQTAPCRLASKGSVCTLKLRIDGEQLDEHGLSGGPNLCQVSADKTPNLNQCYRPSVNNNLDISVAQLPSGLQIIIDGNKLTTADRVTFNAGTGAGIITSFQAVIAQFGGIPAGTIFKVKSPFYAPNTVQVPANSYNPAGSAPWGVWWCQSLALTNIVFGQPPYNVNLESAIYTYDFGHGNLIFTENYDKSRNPLLHNGAIAKFTGAIIGGSGIYSGAKGEMSGYMYMDNHGFVVVDLQFKKAPKS